MELFDEFYDHIYTHIDDLITDKANTFESFKEELERVVLNVSRAVQTVGLKVYTTPDARQNAFSELISALDAGVCC